MTLVLVIGIVCSCLILAYNGYWMLFGITTCGTIVNTTALSCSAGKTSYERHAYEVRFTDTTGMTQIANLDGVAPTSGTLPSGTRSPFSTSHLIQLTSRSREISSSIAC